MMPLNGPVSNVAAALLPPLLVLYPLLLLLEAVEPGFVRSVINPHWFLAALLVIGVLATDNKEQHVLNPRVVGVLAIVAGIAAGVWVWWNLNAGTFGIVVAALAAVAVASVAISAFHGPEKPPS